MAENMTTATETTETTAATETTETTGSEATISKTLYDKKVGELNKKVKQYKEALEERMSADEKAAQAATEREQEFESMKNELNLMKYEKKFLSANYDAETSSVLAKAIVEGDVDSFISAHTAWQAAVKAEFEKQYKEALDNNTPGMRNGVSGDEEPEEVVLARNLAKKRNDYNERTRKALEAYK